MFVWRLLIFSPVLSLQGAHFPMFMLLCIFDTWLLNCKLKKKNIDCYLFPVSVEHDGRSMPCENWIALTLFSLFLPSFLGEEHIGQSDIFGTLSPSTGEAPFDIYFREEFFMKPGNAMGCFIISRQKLNIYPWNLKEIIPLSLRSAPLLKM